MFGPRNLEEAKRYQYEDGTPYDSSNCAAEVAPRTYMCRFQCLRKPGHGPDKIFCKQHAAKLAKEQR